MKRLFVLGAPDPEMAAIEAALRERGEIVAYAIVAGKRVHPGNAYRMDGYIIPEGDPSAPVNTFDVFVECGGLNQRDEDHIDHHFPGNPGYGKSPTEYLEASSLGQVLRLLFGEKKDEERTCPNTPAHYPGFACGHCGYIGYEPTREQRYIAAADHCLLAAYRGECPGIDPDELMRFRVSSRAKFRGVSEEGILRDINVARQALQAAEKRVIASVPVAVLGTDIIPELPEAGCREGIPYISFAPDRNDGRPKEVMEAAPQEVVAEWLEDAKKRGLQNIYGDTARGFAGGYPT